MKNIEHVKGSAMSFGSLEREQPELQKIQLNIGRAFCNGIRPNWEKIFGHNYAKISLPNYPWQKEHFWPDESLGNNLHQIAEKRNGKWGHPFLAKIINLPEEDGTIVWETSLNLLNYPYLEDHKVHETIVFPAAGYIEVALAAINEAFGSGEHQIENFEFKEALSIPEKGSVLLQVVLKNKIGNSHHLKIRSKLENQSQWNNNADCKVLVNYQRDLSTIQKSSGNLISKEDHYQFTKEMGLPYGEVFQTVKKIEVANNVWTAQIKVDDTVIAQTKKYVLHPTLLDGCLQAALNVSRNKVAGSTYVPVFVGEMYVADDLSEINDCTVIFKEHQSGKDWIDADMVIERNGSVLLRMNRFKMKKLEATNSQTDNLESLLYKVNWNEVDLEEIQESAKPLILIDNLSNVQGANNFKELADEVISIDATEWLQNVIQLKAKYGNEANIAIAAFSDIKSSIESFYSAQETSTFILVELLKALSNSNWSPRVYVLTNGVHVEGNKEINTSLAPVWGMGRVILNEHPEFNLTRVDVSLHPTNQEAFTFQKIVENEGIENEWLVRGSKASTARLDNQLRDEEITDVQLGNANEAAFEAVVNEPGIIDNIRLQEIFRKQPKSHQVEVKVKALGINFMNLMSVLGIYPGKVNGFGTLGIECSGVITKVGNQVDHLKVGDAVLGMAYDSMTTHVIVDAGLLRKKPEEMSFEDAATIPTVFLTSYYALIYLGRLQKGERVLIHSATGGVGLSSIQIAHAIGAEVYATAGTEEKRELLKSLGVKYVYNSRDLEFAEAIRKDTNGEGIDMVLNSLTGEAMIRSMNLLRSFGRFLEIGKKDVYENSEIGLAVFNKAISYSMIDLEKMVFETPKVLGELMSEVLEGFKSGIYQPLPKKVYGVGKVKEAFEFMSRAQHIGKIIISMEGENPQIEKLDHPKKQFDSEATYVLTGGYGGLGITFAQWMFENGAVNLRLLGRSGPKPFAKEIISKLEAQGANIIIDKVDVSKKEDLKVVIDSISNHQPLKGIMHLAGILDDSSLLNLTKDQFERVLAPKVNGAWHLHELTKEMNLDFFVLFSSSAGLFGSPGQSAYVAANTFLDQLAAQRKANGLEALAINWGTVSDIGLAAEAGNRADRLAEEGVYTMSPAECIKVYELISDRKESTIGAFRFELSKWEKAYLTAAKNPFFEQLRSDTPMESVQSTSFVEELQLIEVEEHIKEAIDAKLKELVGGVVRKAADKINSKTPFKSLGIDSLMSIQLKNRLEGVFEIPISVTSFWTYSNILDYTKFLIDELPLDAIGSKQTEIVEEEIIEEEVIEEISVSDIADDDISDLLAAELEGL